MILEIEGKKYETGKFSPSIMKLCLKTESDLKTVGNQQTVDDVSKAVDSVVDLLCRFLISGTEKIPYRNITIAQIEELRPVIEDNFEFIELVEIFTRLMGEMSEGITGEGKPRA